MAARTKAVPQLLASLESKSLFSTLNEKYVLENLLREPKHPADFPIVEAQEYLSKLRSHKTVEKLKMLKVQSSLKPQLEFPVPSEAAKVLMTRQAVTSKDLSSFLQTHITNAAAKYELADHIHNGLIELISASSPNNLRSLMNLLAKFWQIGLFDVRPSIYQARTQAKALLLRAIDVHSHTRYEGGGEQTSLPDFTRFQQFLDNFFKYMEVMRKPEDELEDLLLELCAKAGPIDQTTELVLNRSQVTESTLQLYLTAIKRSHPSRDSLMVIKKLLVNSYTGPASIEFLLSIANTQDEVLDLLEVADKSTQKSEIYSRCQLPILQKTIALNESWLHMTYLFGLLERFASVTTLGPAALDFALETALAAENATAVAQILKKTEHTSETVDRANKYVNI